eukprot:5863876-Prymnesium_polylepis.1
MTRRSKSGMRPIRAPTMLQNGRKLKETARKTIITRIQRWNIRSGGTTSPAMFSRKSRAER